LNCATYGKQEGARVGGDGGGGARGSGEIESRNKKGMGREGASTALEPEKRGEGACTGNATATAR
jgi:hypothetical protein